MDYTTSGNSAANATNSARASAVALGQNPYAGAGATALSSSAGLGSYVPINTINAGQVGQISPYYVPSTPSNTTSAGISGAADALLGQTQKQVTQDQNNVDSSKADLQNVANKIVGIQSSQGQMEQDAGLNDKQQAVTNASNAIDISRQAQNNEIAALDKQLLTPSQKIAATNDINHRYALDQANQSVILSAANRDYSTAASMIQHKIDLQLAPLQTQKEFLTTFYNDNKDLLSKAEQNEFSAMSTKASQDYDTAKTQLTQIGDIQKAAIANGAPASVLQAIGQAKTPTDAATIAGRYGVSIQDQFQKSEIAKNYATANGTSGVTSGTTGGVPTALTPYLKTSYDGTKYVDLSSLTSSEKTKYAQIASQSGVQPILDAGTASKISNISVSKENLSNIGTSITNILNNNSIGSIQGTSNSLKSLLGNADIKSFNAWRTAVINNVQALAGGQGSGLRINQAEIDTALKNDLPTITGTGADTLDQANAKLTTLNQQLDTWSKQILGGGNQAATTPKLLAPSEIPAGMYQASDGLLYKK